MLYKTFLFTGLFSISETGLDISSEKLLIEVVNITCAVKSQDPYFSFWFWWTWESDDIYIFKELTIALNFAQDKTNMQSYT